MMVIATFENSIYIELAISALEQKGIPKDKIFAVPLDKRQEPKQIFDTIHQSDGVSIFDAGAILGTCFMLLGAIYGQVLAWGPIIWGIIGAVSGIVLGIGIKLFIFRKKQFSRKKIVSEVVLMIRCDSHQWDVVERILWENTAIGLTRVK